MSQVIKISRVVIDYSLKITNHEKMEYNDYDYIENFSIRIRNHAKDPTTVRQYQKIFWICK